MNAMQQLLMSGIVKNNPVFDILQLMQSGVNPQSVAQQILQNNPEAQRFLQDMQYQARNSSPKEVTLNYARQRGINPNDVMQLAARFGLK